VPIRIGGDGFPGHGISSGKSCRFASGLHFVREICARVFRELCRAESGRRPSRFRSTEIPSTLPAHCLHTCRRATSRRAQSDGLGWLMLDQSSQLYLGVVRRGLQKRTAFVEASGTDRPAHQLSVIMRELDTFAPWTIGRLEPSYVPPDTRNLVKMNDSHSGDLHTFVHRNDKSITIRRGSLSILRLKGTQTPKRYLRNI